LDEPIEFDRWYRGEITEFDGENGKLFGWARFTLTKSGELYIVKDRGLRTGRKVLHNMEAQAHTPGAPEGKAVLQQPSSGLKLVVRAVEPL